MSPYHRSLTKLTYNNQPCSEQPSFFRDKIDYEESFINNESSFANSISLIPD